MATKTTVIAHPVQKGVPLSYPSPVRFRVNLIGQFQQWLSMPSNSIGQEYLEVFDNLEMSSNIERRIGVRILEDYFGRVMTEIGRAFLDQNQPYHRKNVVQQWSAITGWFETEDIDTPDDYSNNIGRLKSLRDDVAHNYLSSVEKKLLLDIREDAEEIRSWLFDKGKEYRRKVDKLSEVQAMERRAEKILQRIPNKGMFDERHLDNRLSEVKDEADELQDRLSKISKEKKRSDGRIPHELVDILHKAQRLDQEVWHLMDRKEELDEMRFNDSHLESFNKRV